MSYLKAAREESRGEGGKETGDIGHGNCALEMGVRHCRSEI